MDAAYFWQKAATCLRLAQALSETNPGRFALLEMAESFERRAREAAANLRSPTQMRSERLEPSWRVSREQLNPTPFVAKRGDGSLVWRARPNGVAVDCVIYAAAQALLLV